VAVRFEQRISVADSSRIVAAAAGLGLEIGWHAGERWCAPAIGNSLRREAAITGERLELLTSRDLERERPHKLLCIADAATRLPALRALSRQLPPGCHAQYSHANYLEITARRVDKANAIRRVCDDTGIDPRAVAAIGDGANDCALLQIAGTGVAMGHAPRAVRDAADWVTDTNDRDGVALAIRRLLSNSRHAPNDPP
jgi:hydroxymethylpyrimidine pyrophosphatase-like HAD family hydrolase